MARPGTFAPGKSGNPGGRPKAILDVIDLARAHTSIAVAALARIVGDQKQPSAAIVAASVALLDRGWGRPGQTIDLKHHIPVATSDDAALLSIALAGSGAAAAQAGDTEESGGLVH